ncbi:hypothetical protein ACFE04_019610 [Oxalis oulophora]
MRSIFSLGSFSASNRRFSFLCVGRVEWLIPGSYLLKGSLKPGVLFGYSKNREDETMALVFTKSIKNELRCAIHRRYGRRAAPRKDLVLNHIHNKGEDVDSPSVEGNLYQHVRAVKWKFSIVVNNDLAIDEKMESWHPKGIGKPNIMDYGTVNLTPNRSSALSPLSDRENGPMWVGVCSVRLANVRKDYDDVNTESAPAQGVASWG